MTRDLDSAHHRMGIDPRLHEDNEPGSQGWLSGKLTVIFDVWIAEYMKDSGRVDEQLREKGFTKVADRLVELFGPEWWTRLAK